MDLSNKLYAYNFSDWKNHIDNDAFREGELGAICVKNGIILPAIREKGVTGCSGGVVDENYSFVAGLLRYDKHKHFYWELNKGYHPKEPVKKSHEKIIFWGATVTHFGHFILEGMSRVWYILDNRELLKDHKIAIVLIPLWNKWDWLWEFIDMLDIPREKIIIIEEPVQFDEVIVPDESVHSAKPVFYREYLRPFQYMREHAPTSPLKRVYLFKGLWNKGAQLCNEEYFFSFYQRKGYVAIAPETLSLKEQIGIISNADYIVSSVGTLSHLALFCKPGTEFTMLSHVDDFALTAQVMINQATNVDWSIVDISQNFLPALHHIGPNLIGPTVYWKKYIMDHFQETTEDNIFQGILYDYMLKWCQDFTNYNDYYQYFHNMTSMDVFGRLYRVICGKELDFSKYKKTVESKKDLRSLGDYSEILKGRPFLEYDVHLSEKGWQYACYEDMQAGDHKHGIEALQLRFSSPFFSLSYSSYAKGEWDKEVSDGAMSGTTGKARQLHGVRIRLDDEGEKQYSLLYRGEFSKSGWSEWIDHRQGIYKDDEVMTGLQVKLVSKDVQGIFLVQTYFDTWLCLDEHMHLCHKENVEQEYLPIYFRWMGNEGMGVLFVEKDNRYMFVAEVDNDGCAKLSDFPSVFCTLKNDNQIVAFIINGRWISARDDETIRFAPKNLAWEKFRLVDSESDSLKQKKTVYEKHF